MLTLTNEQMNKIDKAALEILKRIGLNLPHGPSLEILKTKAGVHVDGNIVRFDGSVVLEQTKGLTGCSGYNTHVIAGAYCHNYLEAGSEDSRPSTENDLLKSILQADALGFGVCAPVVPLDIPGPKQELRMERLTHENAKFSYGSGQITNPITAQASLEMCAAVGRPKKLELWVTSPFNLHADELEIIWSLRHLDPEIIICNMPIRGLTAPMSLAGLMAQSVAETLGAATIVKLLNISSRVGYRIDAFWSYPVDMQSGNIPISGADYLRLFAVNVQMAKRHGISVPAAKVLMTGAKTPDIQAAMEKGTQSIVAEIVGAETFMAAGTLSAVEVFSPVQMVIDKEILSFIDAFTAPLDFDENHFDIDVMEEVGHEGLFIMHETTVKNFRKACWMPELFSMNALYSWVAQGKPSILEKANDVLNSLKLRQGPAVSAEIQKELIKIENKFAAML